MYVVAGEYTQEVDEVVYNRQFIDGILNRIKEKS